MKTKLFILILSICLGFVGYSQNTTEEEYNWMTKGYKIMLSSGLDMKKGYKFEEALEYTDTHGSYSFTFKYLLRETNNSYAGIIIIARSSVSGNTYYYGLPIGGYEYRNNKAFFAESPFMSNFLTSIRDLDRTMTDAFFASLFKLYLKSIIPVG